MKSVILATLCVCLVMIGMASSASVYRKKAVKSVDWHSVFAKKAIKKQNVLRAEDGDAGSSGGDGGHSGGSSGGDGGHIGGSSGGDGGHSGGSSGGVLEECTLEEYTEEERKDVMDVGFSMVDTCHVYDELVLEDKVPSDHNLHEPCYIAYGFVNEHDSASDEKKIDMENCLFPHKDLIHCLDVFLEATIIHFSPETAALNNLEFDEDAFYTCLATYDSVENEEKKVDEAFDEAEHQPEPSQQIIMSRIINLLKKELKHEK